MEKTPPGTSLSISAGRTSNDAPERMLAAMNAAASSCANTWPSLARQVSTGARDAACPVSAGARDAACPASTGTEGGRVRLVRERKGGRAHTSSRHGSSSAPNALYSRKNSSVRGGSSPSTGAICSRAAALMERFPSSSCSVKSRQSGPTGTQSQQSGPTGTPPSQPSNSSDRPTRNGLRREVGGRRLFGVARRAHVAGRAGAGGVLRLTASGFGFRVSGFGHARA